MDKCSPTYMNSNMKKLISILIVLLSPAVALADSFFIVRDAVAMASSEVGESFVLRVQSDSEAAEIRSLIASGDVTRKIVVAEIAEGNDGINVDYYRAGNPRWKWHVENLVALADTVTAEDTPKYTGKPSDLNESASEWIAENGNVIAWTAFRITSEIAGSMKSEVVNMSTRGAVGSGNSVLIAGFVIQGAVPRSIVVQVRGPSLEEYGIPDFLATPRLKIYHNQELLADIVGDRIEDESVLAVLPPSLENEPRILIALAPGSYTAVVSGEGHEGVCLLEVNDMDALLSNL